MTACDSVVKCKNMANVKEITIKSLLKIATRDYNYLLYCFVPKLRYKNSKTQNLPKSKFDLH